MPTAEITRAETRQRARLLRVRSYDVEFDFTRGEEVFGSVSVISFDCAEPGAASHADLVAADVREITLNGVPLDPATAWADGRITLPALAARNELRVAADCRYTHSGTGMHRSAGPDGTYIYGKFAPAYARTAYACFDQPDLKAAFTFRAIVPAPWTVLSNAPAAGAPEPEPPPEPAPEPPPEPPPEPAPAGDGRARWHFVPTTLLPTFTTTVVAGDYHVVTASHTTPSGQRIPLEMACRAGLAGHLDAGALFEVTRQGLDLYTGLLADYPYAKYAHAFVPEFSAGASEDAGCVLVSEQFLFRSRVTAAMDEFRSYVILHEMAHMWFGDLVSVQWWDDIWLSEAFATFCGYEASARLGRFPLAWSSFSFSDKAWGFAQDRLPSTHPVANDTDTLSEAIANYDGISYAKGAAVLRQLAAYVGQESFFAGLRAYLAGHAYGHACLADLLAAVAASSGRPLAAWSRAWLETAGPNTLRARFRTDDSGAFTEFAVRQDAPADHPTLRPHHIGIGLYRIGLDGGGRRVGWVEADVAGPRTDVPALIGTAQPDLVLLNDGDTGYVLVRFDPRSLRTVTESIGELADPAARAVCWNAVIDMVRQAELPVPEYAAMLARGLEREPSVRRLQALLTVAEQVTAQLAGAGQAAAAKGLLAGTAARMLPAAEPGSDHQLAWAQLLGWTATEPGQLDLVAGLLDATPVRSLSVDAGLRWSLLQRLAVAGRAGDARIDDELARDPADDQGQRCAAACRAAIPDAGHKEAAWQLLTGGQLGAESVQAVARGFMLPEQAVLLTPYAGRYLATLEEIWATHPGHLRLVLGELLFPYPAVSPALIAQIDDYLARPRDPALARLLAERRDIARRALGSRALGSRALASDLDTTGGRA